MNNKGVSIVITTKNRPANLAFALTSLIGQTYRPLSVHILLNGQHSIDPSCERMINLLELNGIHVSCDERYEFTFAECHDFLINRADYDLVCRMDDDQVATPGYFENLASVFSRPNVGAVGGIVLHPEEKKLQWELADLSKALSRGREEGMVITELQLHRHPSATILEVTDLYSSFMMDRNAVRDVGGVAICYRACSYREETDLTLRLHVRGYSVLIQPSSIMWHLRCDTGGERVSGEEWRRKVDTNKELFLCRLNEFGVNFDKLKQVYIQQLSKVIRV